MKYTLISLFALVSVALAISAEEHNDFIKRQANVQKGVPVNVAAMTDQAGNVILFDTKGVYKDASAKGL
ncbi:hypothetical protein QBC33DRAFT_559730 [Phialemonium atrogriseum]|uniref:Uncharacterized protein n=1 Tax=Phialemonium atrogriseum TaxID=1093897 RepID=A0AAJ0FL86_9PEZI|nr:uncharacterized protein QBC33DRAFT_559730 [Phialemonium atrogriseum]KAK1766409.1 hypothetical protein QBC33DRAFT_559730 [Phialemonium atrogriseum]